MQSESIKSSTGRFGVNRWGTWFFGVLALGGVVSAVLHFSELDKFVSLVKGIEPIWLVLAVLAQTATYVCIAMVWKRTLQRSGYHQPLWKLMSLGVAKLFTDQAVPSGGISGTLLVVRGLSQRGVPSQTAVTVMLVSLISLYSAFLLMVLMTIVILFLHHHANSTVITVSALFSAFAIAVPTLVIILKQLGARAAASKLQRFPGFANVLEAIHKAPTRLLRNFPLLGEAIVFQSGIFFLDSLTLWIVFHALQVPVDFWIAFASFVMASVAAVIGLIPLGLGTFEAGAVGVLRMLGVPLEAALMATLLLRGFTFWLPMAPGIWLARHEISRPRQES